MMMMNANPYASPTLGEKMNRAMGLDPGFTLERPSLVNAVRANTNSTVERAQANVEQQRQNAADIERIAKAMQREAKRKAVRARAAGESAA